MEIGGKNEFKNVTRESFAIFVEKCEIRPKAVLDRLDALAEKLPLKATELKERMSDVGAPSPVYDEIRAVIERHRVQVM